MMLICMLRMEFERMNEQVTAKRLQHFQIEVIVDAPDFVEAAKIAEMIKKKVPFEAKIFCVKVETIRKDQ